MPSKIGVLKEGKAIYPFWGKRFDKITGLDPLGQQNASEKIYSHLMPGITNLTNRIRYYGFYCWLLSEYVHLHENHFNQDDQRRFIRRAELSIALVMNKLQPGVLQIPGSNTAVSLLEEHKNQSVIELKPYTDDPNANGSYWKYSSGAFGQYYAASIRQMGLIKEMVSENQLVYMVTEESGKITGQKLANSFDKSLKLESKQRFLNIIEEGKLPVQDIPLIYEFFNITKIKQDTDEWNDYYELLTGPDLPVLNEESDRHRYETIQIILEKSEQNEKGLNSTDLLNELFEQGLAINHKQFSTEFGWYQYRLNEFWQFACGTFFWSLLEFLSSEKNGIYKEETLIEEYTVKVCEEAGINPGTQFTEHIREIDVLSIQKIISETDQLVKSHNSIAAGKNALNILFMLFSLSEKRLNNYLNILTEKSLVGTGSFLKTTQKLFNKELVKKPFNFFLTNFIRSEILNRHRIVAINKLGKGSRSTLKFETDGEYILYDNNFPPAFTNPRMDTLFKILTDLQVLRLNEVGNYIVHSTTNNT